MWAAFVFGAYAIAVTSALTTAHLSGSKRIFGAAILLTFLWVASIALWFLEAGAVGWRFVVLDVVALAYFLRRWTESGAQHRLFHFVLAASHMTLVTVSALKFGLAEWLGKPSADFTLWYQLIVNVIYLGELIWVFVYALLFRRAKRDPVKWLDDTEKWLDRFK